MLKVSLQGKESFFTKFCSLLTVWFGFHVTSTCMHTEKSDAELDQYLALKIL